MGAIVPQVITEDKADGAQIIDGSLRFDNTKAQYITRTPSSAGNRTAWTLSFWFKKNQSSATLDYVLGASSDGFNNNYSGLFLATSFEWQEVQSGVTVCRKTAAPAIRDHSAWYHVVVVWDTNNATADDRYRFYLNGTRITTFTPHNTNPSSGLTSLYNSAIPHYFSYTSSTFSTSCLVSQHYFVDGQALDPSYFGYTDPLTNTWRPKKYIRTTTITGDTGGAVGFGTNGFYLPFDGNTPIGQNRSGNVGINTWTPVNFGGSNTLEKATGALPILNTDGGGKVARVGVRTDSNASSLVLALPLVGIKSDFSNKVNSGTTEKAVTNNSVTFSSSFSNFYGGSASFSNSSGSRLTIPDSADWNIGGTFTVEFWVYRTSASRGHIVGQYDYPNNSSGAWAVELDGNGSAVGTNKLFLGVLDPGSGADKNYNCDYAGYNQWDHIAVCRESNGTPRIYINGISQTVTTGGGSGSGNISDVSLSLAVGGEQDGAYALNGYIQDLRIYKGLAKYTQNFIPASTDPDILPDTPSGVAYSSNVALVPSTDGAVAFDGSGDYLQLNAGTDFAYGTGDFTVESFVYPVATGEKIIYGQTVSGTNYFLFYKDSSTEKLGFISTLSGGGTPLLSSSTLSLNVWYHVAVTRQSGTVRLFINGILEASTTNNVDLTNTTYNPTIGAFSHSSTNAWNGFISNLHVVKGTALYTANFTPPTGPISSVANTKLLCCKSNSSATAFDVSPGTITANGNVAATNFNPFTVNINTQRGQESGYCTLNPLRKSSGSSEPTISEGNLTITAGGAGWCNGGATIDITSGKWYWEVYPRTVGGSGLTIGIASEGYEWNRDTTATGLPWLGSQTGTSWSVYSTGSKYFNASGTSYMSAFTSSDTVGVAFDMDAQTLTYYLNGVSQGVAFSGVNAGGKSIQVGISVHGSGSNKASANFGQKPFKFPPPAGFQPLALANTPRPTIVRPDQYVGIVTYTGNGSTQSVSGYNFKPDFVWIKDRGVGWNHQLYDSVRGVGANKELTTSQTWREGDTTNMNTGAYGYVSSLDASGFTLNPGSGGAGQYVNQSTKPYVAWCWKAGGNSNTFNINDIGYSTASAAGLTAGTITPTGASVNTKSGFSIITWTSDGASSIQSLSHGMNATPAFIIAKNRSISGKWWVWHKSFNNQVRDYLDLQLTDATTTAGVDVWSTSSTTFGMRQATIANNTNLCVAYLWAEIPGFSKFGSYTGNGSTDGPFVFTGHRSRFLMVKRTDTTGDWYIVDTARSTSGGANVVDQKLYPNLSVAENGGSGETTSTNNFDILSNGFKCRTTNGNTNANGGTYIYAAFAEAPSFNLYGGQSNAR